MDMLAKRLNDIRAAYLIGRLKPVMETTEKEITAEELVGYTVLPPVEQELLVRCNRYHATALQACREGKYAIAEYLFADTEKLLKAFSPMGRLIAQSAHEAALAYLDYRHGRFEIGTERIYRALTCDEALEEHYGLTLYHIHRLHLLTNLVRLKRRQGEGKEALRLGIALIDYLEQKVSSLPFPTTWDAQRLDLLPLASKNVLFEQTMHEVMFLMVGQEAHLTNWSMLSEHTHMIGSSTCQLSPHAHLWLQAQQALQAHNPELFCELALPLIAAGPAGSLWFWYGLAIDIVILCRELPFESAELLLQTVAVDISRWSWAKLPPLWKQIFETTSVRVHV